MCKTAICLLHVRQDKVAGRDRQEDLAKNESISISLQMDKALREAVFRAGGARSLARKLGVSHQTIVQWKRCPVLRVLEVEKLTGVSKERLRPDIYPP
jgi:hypothetical protein